MILVTVGTQLGFDRLMTWVDHWAARNPGVNVFCQTGPGRYVPQHCLHEEFVSPDSLKEMVERAEVIVSHAGMGSILTALRYRKPIIIVPRLAAQGEHRNDHQLATATWLADRPGIFWAKDEAELHRMLDGHRAFDVGQGISEFASDELINALREAIA